MHSWEQCSTLLHVNGNAQPSSLREPCQITLYCIAETFDRKKLDGLLKMTYLPGSVLSYPVRVGGFRRRTLTKH